MQLQHSDQVPQLLAVGPEVQPGELALVTERCVIGRAAICDLVINQRLVSRLHAVIERHGPRYLLRDTDSANGTYVNGHRLSGLHQLKHDDLLGFGALAPQLRFLDPDPTFMSGGRLGYNERALVFQFDGQSLDLSAAQFRLLLHLYQQGGELCSRESCAQALWGRDYEPGLDAGALDQAINTLRGKLRQIDPDLAEQLKTRRGLGYTLEL